MCTTATVLMPITRVLHKLSEGVKVIYFSDSGQFVNLENVRYGVRFNVTNYEKYVLNIDKLISFKYHLICIYIYIYIYSKLIYIFFYQ